MDSFTLAGSSVVVLIVAVIAALVAGAVIAFVACRSGVASTGDDERQLQDLREQLGRADGLRDGLESQIALQRQELERRQKALEAAEERERTLGGRVAELQAKLDAANTVLNSEEQRTAALRDRVTAIFNEQAQKALEERHKLFDRDIDERRNAIDAMMAPLHENVTKLMGEVANLQQANTQGRTQLNEQIQNLVRSNQDVIKKADELQNATTTLSTALRNPRVRGNWGEQALDNVLELAGMASYCGADDQFTLRGDDSAGRPDKLIRLPNANGLRVAVDAKAPGDHFFAACEAPTEEERKRAMAEHGRAMLKHVEQLAARNYGSYENMASPVIMFIPSEGMLAAAVSEVPNLIDKALEKGVYLASPLNLLLMLQAYAAGWKQVQQEANAKKISEAATELYRRLGTFAAHFAKVGSAIAIAATAYGNAVGSYERQLLPQALRMEALGAADPQKKEGVERLKSRDITVRQLAAGADADLELSRALSASD